MTSFKGRDIGTGKEFVSLGKTNGGKCVVLAFLDFAQTLEKIHPLMKQLPGVLLPNVCNSPSPVTFSFSH